MDNRLNSVNKFLREEDAPTMVEYGFLVVGIALLVYGVAIVFGTGLSSIFTTTGSIVSDAPLPFPA